MAESARLLAQDVFGARAVRQWVLSFPYPLRFPQEMGAKTAASPMRANPPRDAPNSRSICPDLFKMAGA